MAAYTRICGEFSKAGYQQTQEVSIVEINSALDEIIFNNVGIPEFDRSVSMQMFEQTNRNNEDKVLLKEYIQVIIKAHEILRKNIGTLRESLPKEVNQDKKKQLLSQMHQFQQDLKLLTIPFNLPGPQKIPQLEGFVEQEQNMTDRSIYIEVSQTKRSNSKRLAATLIIAAVWLILELPCSMGLHNFMDIMVSMGILGIFVLECFDKLYVRACIVSLFVALILDIIWLIVMQNIYLTQPTTFNQSYRSAYLTGYEHFSYYASIVFLVIKVVLIVMLYPFRHNPPESITVAKFGQYRWQLSGRPKNNPLLPLFQRKIQILSDLE